MPGGINAVAAFIGNFCMLFRRCLVNPSFQGNFCIMDLGKCVFHQIFNYTAPCIALLDHPSADLGISVLGLGAGLAAAGLYRLPIQCTHRWD
jgi:hypothetical protein